jgi:hypothetical protein
LLVEAEPHRPGQSAGASCPRRAPRSLPRVGRNHEKVAPSRQRQFVQWPQTLRGCHLPRGEFLAAKGSPGGQRQHSRCVLAEDLPLRQSAARSAHRASAKALCRPSAAISFADRGPESRSCDTCRPATKMPAPRQGHAGDEPVPRAAGASGRAGHGKLATKLPQFARKAVCRQGYRSFPSCGCCGRPLPAFPKRLWG